MPPFEPLSLFKIIEKCLAPNYFFSPIEHPAHRNMCTSTLNFQFLSLDSHYHAPVAFARQRSKDPNNFGSVVKNFSSSNL